jgi:predicted nucleotidyltransferase
MRNPFSSSARPRFVDRDEILGLARSVARRIASERAEVLQVVLFGSFARNDYGARSDLDLLIVLDRSDAPFPERVSEFLRFAPAYPTDVFPYTREEIDGRLAAQDPFLSQALREGIVLYPIRG